MLNGQFSIPNRNPLMNGASQQKLNEGTKARNNTESFNLICPGIYSW